MTSIVLAFTFKLFLVFLVWACLAVMAMWMFQKTKGRANLLMMVGAGLLALAALLWSFETFNEFVGFWLPLFGAIVVTAAFYLTAKPVVDAHIDTLKKKLQEATKEKAAGDPPPSDAAEESTEG